ncbi:hypothetical protein [Rhodococcus zopfii]|uniref:hypothetical protein n=1 Tax=Rhodococcus zopfii TaxID=43772 RepID=UPI003526E831
MAGRLLVGGERAGGELLGGGLLRCGLLAREDVADLVFGPALAGDALQFVGDRLALRLVAGERVGDGVGVAEGVGEGTGVEDRGVGALALVVERRRAW